MFEKEAKEYVQDMAKYYESALDSIPSQFEMYLRKAVEYGYNKAKEDVKYDLMMKLKDEGIVKLLKDSILRNERLNSQEQQELCAWIECAMDFGENLDECAKELEQIRNERNLFQEKCEDIELNYYCDKLECRFLSRNKWHYVKDGDLPADKTEKKYLVALKSEYGGFFYETDIWCESLHCFASNNPTKIYAWKEIVPPSEPMRSLDKEEQKNYTEAINKVYKPTGVKLFDKENE